ncbi:MAG: GNAT family N-acetyltransferase [Candidatus Eisenbacteria bacterium]|nr:GNAT family N-acetyltransferase [Candidatus Eisenbacteria bacterium]
MTIIEMTDADIPEVSALLGRSYGAVAEREGLSADQERFLVSERGSIGCVRRESQHQHYLVARESGSIIGVVAVSGDLIAKLYVDPESQGQGVGRALYGSAERLILGTGHSRVRLGAFPTAVPFYQRMGLSVVREKRATGPLTGWTVMLMEKHLGEAT